MTDEPTNLVLEQLRAIRAEQALTTGKIGALAESMVSMRKRMDDFDTALSRMDAHIQGLRGDVRMIAMAVDEHTTRLDRIEHKLNLHDA